MSQLSCYILISTPLCSESHPYCSSSFLRCTFSYSWRLLLLFLSKKKKKRVFKSEDPASEKRKVGWPETWMQQGYPHCRTSQLIKSSFVMPISFTPKAVWQLNWSWIWADRWMLTQNPLPILLLLRLFCTGDLQICSRGWCATWGYSHGIKELKHQTKPKKKEQNQLKKIQYHPNRGHLSWVQTSDWSRATCEEEESILLSFQMAKSSNEFPPSWACFACDSNQYVISLGLPCPTSFFILFFFPALLRAPVSAHHRSLANGTFYIPQALGFNVFVSDILFHDRIIEL